MPSLALHVTFPESPTASKENLLDHECPNTRSLAYKNQQDGNKKQNQCLIARVLKLNEKVLLKNLWMSSPTLLSHNWIQITPRENRGYHGYSRVHGVRNRTNEVSTTPANGVFKLHSLWKSTEISFLPQYQTSKSWVKESDSGSHGKTVHVKSQLFICR